MDVEPLAAHRRKATVSGTNLELTGDYNQRLVYQAVRSRGPITRNALIELTGLAKPTIAGIVRRLLAAGLVAETGRLYGGRGQPAVHLEADRAGCFAIGIEIGNEAVRVLMIDAQGGVVGAAHADPAAGDGLGATMPALIDAVERERIIGVGIAEVPAGNGGLRVRGDAAKATIARLLPGIPIFADDRLAAAVAGESMFGRGPDLGSYYYILLDRRPIGGLVLPQGLVRGVHPDRTRYLFGEHEAVWTGPLPVGQGGGDWLDAACRDLVPLLTSIECLLDPGAVLLGGPFGADLALLAGRCETLLGEQASIMPSRAPVRPAALADDAVLLGAACLAMRARLYPTEEALLKTLDHAA